MKWLIFGVVLGFLVGFFFNSFDLSMAEGLSKEEGVVTKVIDGDTLVSNGENIRLLGIDTDEKGYPCYSAAKERLEELTLGKNVVLERGVEDRGQYGRLLRYIILDGENVNIKMVSEGFAAARFFPPNKKYKTEIIEAEANAIHEKIGCKWQR